MMESTKNLGRAQVLNVIYDFFKQFKTWYDQSPRTPDLNELERYLSKDLQMFNNGQLIIKGAANYLNRLQKFQNKYSQFQVSEPLEEPVVGDNRASLYYRIDLTTHDGQQKQVYIMALITTEENKISRWVAVSHEKGTGNWDA